MCGRDDGSPATCRLLIKPIQHILKCVHARVRSPFPPSPPNERPTCLNSNPLPHTQTARNLKRVLSLRIYMDEGEQQPDEGAVVEPHLVFDIHCDVGVLKRHIFQLQDCEIVHALFHREGTRDVSFLRLLSSRPLTRSIYCHPKARVA